ncbi:hypothetical protein GCM10029963_35970 [Micromonospora andamanensis]
MIQVRPEESDWEGAAERVLRGFALSLLVPDAHYSAVADWVDRRHLGGRLVYYRVPATLPRQPEPGYDERQALFAKLELHPESPLRPWLERELRRRAGYQCVDSLAEFRRIDRALTRTGQVKDVGGRHEKDDRSRIDDRSGYVLGWSVEQKIDALLAKAQLLAERQTRATADRDGLIKQLNRLTGRHGTLSKLVEFTDFTELDWAAAVQRIERLRSEKRQLEASSGELARLTAELERVTVELTELGDERDTRQSRIGQVRGQVDRAEQGLRDTRRLLDEPGYGAALECFDTLGKRAGDTVPAEPAGFDRLRDEIETQLRLERDEAARRQAAASNRAVGRMADFRRRYPLEAAELDNSIQSAGSTG